MRPCMGQTDENKLELGNELKKKLERHNTMKGLTPQQCLEIDACYQIVIKKCQIHKVNPQKVVFGTTAFQYIEACIGHISTWKICIIGHPPDEGFENVGLQTPQK